MYGVTLGTLAVRCCHRGMSLAGQGGGLAEAHEPALRSARPDAAANGGVLEALREAAQAMGKDSVGQGWPAQSIGEDRQRPGCFTRQCWTRRLHDDLASARLGAWLIVGVALDGRVDVLLFLL